jgi:splicing factor 3A subunit 1
MLSKLRDSTRAQDDEITRNLVRLARTRPDIFGSTDEEVSRAVSSSIAEKQTTGGRRSRGPGACRADALLRRADGGAGWGWAQSQVLGRGRCAPAFWLQACPSALARTTPSCTLPPGPTPLPQRASPLPPPPPPFT